MNPVPSTGAGSGRSTVTELWRHPVKSMMGERVDVLTVEPWGAVGDRRWGVVDAAGRSVTARTVPTLLSIRVRASTTGEIELRRTAGPALTVAPPIDGPAVEVGYSRLDSALDAGDAAAALISGEVGQSVRLVWQPDPLRRPVNPRNGGRPGECLTLADAGPLLLTTEASLRQLQVWAGTTDISMRRFRPNIVIDGGEPFDEDRWTRVRIGATSFRVQEHCDRCMMTTFDPETLERGEEPLATLRRHRQWNNRTFFGVRLVPVHRTGSAVVGVGDPVEAIGGGSPPPGLPTT